MKAVYMAVGALVLTASMGGATADQATRNVTFESRSDVSTSGAVCLVRAQGKAFQVTTPASADIPLDGTGKINISSMFCTHDGKIRKTDFFPSASANGSVIHGVAIDFNSAQAEFWFTDAAGNVALYTRGGQVVTVD